MQLGMANGVSCVYSVQIESELLERKECQPASRAVSPNARLPNCGQKR